MESRLNDMGFKPFETKVEVALAKLLQEILFNSCNHFTFWERITELG